VPFGNVSLTVYAGHDIVSNNLAGWAHSWEKVEMREMLWALREYKVGGCITRIAGKGSGVCREEKWNQGGRGGVQGHDVKMRGMLGALPEYKVGGGRYGVGEEGGALQGHSRLSEAMHTEHMRVAASLEMACSIRHGLHQLQAIVHFHALAW
jgi:hypothetical protein